MRVTDFDDARNEIAKGLTVAIVGFATELLIKSFFFGDLGGKYQWVMTLIGIIFLVGTIYADYKNILKGSWYFGIGFVIGSFIV